MIAGVPAYQDIDLYWAGLKEELVLSDDFFLLSKECGWPNFVGYRVQQVLGFKETQKPLTLSDPGIALVTFAFNQEFQISGYAAGDCVPLFLVSKHSLRLAPTAFEHLLGDAFEED